MMCWYTISIRLHSVPSQMTAHIKWSLEYYNREGGKRQQKMYFCKNGRQKESQSVLLSLNNMKFL